MPYARSPLPLTRAASPIFHANFERVAAAIADLDAGGSLEPARAA
jgi:hypothetical protein